MSSRAVAYNVHSQRKERGETPREGRPQDPPGPPGTTEDPKRRATGKTMLNVAEKNEKHQQY